MTFVVNRTTYHLLKYLAIDDNINYDQAKTLNVSAWSYIFWENFENTSKINPSLPSGLCDYIYIMSDYFHKTTFCNNGHFSK